MGLSIKRIATEQRARAVAERLGVSVTEAIHQSLEEKWRALTAEKPETETRKKRDEFFAYLAALPKSERTVEEIEAEMYGEHGEPI